MTNPLDPGQQSLDKLTAGHPLACKALRELRRDAERYRWLRDKSPGQFEQPIVVTQARTVDHVKYIGPLAYSELDDIIDSAIVSTA